jgi:hypothetical protein
MDTLQILCTLRDVNSFLGVFPSDLLPHSVTRPGTLIVNADSHAQTGSHWLAISIQPVSYTVFFMDSFGLPPSAFVAQEITVFLTRNCAVFDHNRVRLQGLYSRTCGKYCWLFALYMDTRYSPYHFIHLFTAGDADAQVHRFFRSEFGRLRRIPRGGQRSTCLYKVSADARVRHSRDGSGGRLSIRGEARKRDRRHRVIGGRRRRPAGQSLSHPSPTLYILSGTRRSATLCLLLRTRSHLVLGAPYHSTGRGRPLRPTLLLRPDKVRLSIRSGRAHVRRSDGIPVSRVPRNEQHAGAIIQRQALPQILVSGMRDAQRTFLLSVADASSIHDVAGQVSYA